MLGKTKGKGKALVTMSTARVAKVAENLIKKSESKALTDAQAKRLARATTILGKRTPANADGGTTPPPPAGVTVPDFPTSDPPPGHRWVYNATTNSYQPEPIPVATTTPTTDLTAYTGTYTPTGTSTAPDFSSLSSTWTGGPNSFDAGGAAVPAPVNPMDAALNAAQGGASEPMSTTTKVAIGAAALGLLFMLKKRKGRSA